MRKGKRSLEILDSLPDSRNAGIAYIQAGMIYRLKGDLLAADGSAAVGPPLDPRDWYRKSLDTLRRAAAIDRAADEENRRVMMQRGKPVPRHQAIGLPALYLELARTDRRLNQPAHAVSALRYGLLLDPYDPQFYFELSEAHKALADPQQAAIALLEGMRMIPAQAEFAMPLAALYRQMDPGCQALSREGDFIRLNLACELLHRHVCQARRNLAQLFTELERNGQAAAIVNEAVTQLGCAARN